MCCKSYVVIGIVWAGLLLFVSPLSQATPDWSGVNWSSLSISVGGMQNSSENGLYVWTSNNGFGGSGVYTHFPTNEYGTPFIEYEDGNGWVLENGVGTKDAYFGGDIFPLSSATVMVSVSSQANNVEANPGGSVAATKEPVNVINGAMFLGQADFDLAAAGFNLGWSRSYNSTLPATNGLGFGWGHSYDWRLSATTNTFINGVYTNSLPALYFLPGTGNARLLIKDVSSNVWRSVLAPPVTVSLTASNEYAMTLPPGLSCIFDSTGFIKSASNSWHDSLSFSYTNIANAAYLSKVTHSDGRSLQLSYSDNRLVRVDTPSTNLYYLYAYDAAGELTNVTAKLPSGDYSTAYTYDTNGIHALMACKNAQNEVAVYAYETNAQGQLTSKCILVDVATNYYGHTISYSNAATSVSYNHGNTNATYRYVFDPVSRKVTRVIFPSDTNEVIALTYDPYTQLPTSEQFGITINLTNDVWTGKCYSVSAQYPDNSNMAGVYTYGGMQNGKGYYNNPNGFQLIWTGTQWKIGPAGLIYYKVSSDYPDGGGWTNVYTNVTTVYVTCLTNAVTVSNVFLAASSTYRRYDVKGHLTAYYPAYTSTSSPSWSLTWNTNWDMVASITDPEGHRMEWDYTNGAVSVERICPVTNQSAETRYAYGPNGLLTSVTNANGNWARFHYGSYGYPTQVVMAAGQTNGMEWNMLGQLKTITLPGHISDTNSPPNMIPRMITFDPNELGWVRKITYPDATFETFAFDALGNLTNHVDIAGRTNRFTWLPTRKLASLTRFLTAGGSNQEAKISLNYDQQMNALRIKDELDRGVESYQLDLQDRPVLVTNVEGQVMTLSWGLKSLLKTMVRFDGSTNTLSHDSADRVSQLAYPDDTLAMTYFNNNLLKTVGNSRGTITNAYDGANRLTAQTQPVPAGSLLFGYYPAGQLSNVVSAAGTNTYALDSGDRLQGLTCISPGGRDSVSYSYDSVSGLLTGANYSNGIHCLYAYDLMDRLTGVTWTDVSNKVLKSRVYTYTPAGLISNITCESGERVVYTYDSLDRLIRERHTDYHALVISDEQYEYDLSGNRTRKSNLDGDGNTLVTVSYSFPTANKLGSWIVAETNLATRFSVVGDSDDPIGVDSRYGKLWVSNSPSAYFTPYVANNTNFYAFDLICGMGTQYIHAAIRDVAGNTSYVTNRFYPVCLTNGTYQYNAAGCLTNRQYSGKDHMESLGLTWNSQYQLMATATNGVWVESYGYDGIGRRIFIVEGGITNWMVYDGNQVVAEVDGAGVLKRSYVYGPGIDNPISMTTYGATTNTYYFIRDHLGSTLALVDGGATVVESYRYDAWGRVLGIYNGAGSQIDKSAVGNRILWMGREYSFLAGIYYFRARWYDPVTGRWLSSDPVGISGGLNQYAFCANNPVNKVDPYGLWAWDHDWVQMGVGGLFGFYGKDVASSWMNVEQGAYATLDGLIPLVDPFSKKYNGCDETLQTSRNFGQVSQGLLLSAVPFRPFTAPIQQVTHWGPPLQPGSWVMTGGPSIRNWVMAGASHPAWKYETTVIVEGALKYPSGWQWIKGLFGQRIYVPMIR